MLYSLARSEPMASNEPDNSAPPIPTSLFGYEVIDRIGEGAGAWVYAVSQPSTGQIFALKHVVPKTDKDMRYIAQLENEYTVAKQFRNGLLRRAIDYKVNKSLFRRITEAALILELVDGVSLDKHAPMPLKSVMDIFLQAGRALSAVHYLLYVHCDFKPNNILVQPDGKIKLIDFGQCCRSNTIKERVQGTPDFISPEQVRLKPVTIRTDIYCYGASFYWALTGRPVPTLFTVEKADRDVVIKGRFPTPAELNAEVPAALSELVMECVRSDALKRPQDMHVVVARLGEIKVA